MHPTKLLGTICCLALALGSIEAIRPVAVNPLVVEFGTADPALVQCFDKTIYALSKSPTAVSFISPTNINYVKVETLKAGPYGGVTAEITSGAIRKQNIVISMNEGGKTLLKSNIRVTMFCVR